MDSGMQKVVFIKIKDHKSKDFQINFEYCCHTKINKFLKI